MMTFAEIATFQTRGHVLATPTHLIWDQLQGVNLKNPKVGGPMV